MNLWFTYLRATWNIIHSKMFIRIQLISVEGAFMFCNWYRVCDPSITHQNLKTAALGLVSLLTVGLILHNWWYHYLLGHENCNRTCCIVFLKYVHPLVQMRNLKLYTMLQNNCISPKQYHIVFTMRCLYRFPEINNKTRFFFYISAISHDLASAWGHRHLVNRIDINHDCLV